MILCNIIAQTLKLINFNQFFKLGLPLQTKIEKKIRMIKMSEKGLGSAEYVWNKLLMYCRNVPWNWWTSVPNYVSFAFCKSLICKTSQYDGELKFLQVIRGFNWLIQTKYNLSLELSTYHQLATLRTLWVTNVFQ